MKCNDLLYLPFANMKHPWALDKHDMKFLFQTRHADMKKGPIPVVIIELAKTCSTQMDLLPYSPCKCHPHIMLGT